MPETVEVIPDIKRGNKADAAQFFDISLPTLEKWIRDGMPIVQRGARGVSWIIDLRAAAQWRYEARLPSGEIDPETLSPMERKSWYDGEKSRRDLQVRDSELIPIGDVERNIGTSFAAVSQSIQGLEDHLSRRAGLSPEQAQVVEDVVFETLDALADQLSVYAPALAESLE